MKGDSKDKIDYYQELASGWLKGTLTPEKQAELDQWYLENQQDPIEVPASVAASEDIHAHQLWKKIWKKIKADQAPLIVPLRRRMYRWTAAAAAVVLMALSVYWGYKAFRPVSAPDLAVMGKSLDIAPGRSGAVLHLSNGISVVLDSLQDGMVVQQGAVKIVKENGELKYIGKSKEVIYNDIVTNRGRQWKMLLPDGTEVWLNAASSLHFPVSFEGQKQRIVELKGEAYFKVAHNAAQPFKVIAGNQVIEDIGTAFNVNAYADESSVMTTLVEGIVKVNNVQLRPGQQARLNAAGTLEIKEVNTREITAWVNGQISLENVTVRELMRQLSRWYDVDIVYEGTVPNIRLGGMIDRKVYLSDIISVLNAYGIDLKLQGRTIVVSPK